MIATTTLRFLCNSLINRNFRLFVLTLDMAIPPLTLLGLLVSSIILLSAIGAWVGFSPIALLISAADLAAYLAAILLCWWKFSDDILPARAIWDRFTVRSQEASSLSANLFWSKRVTLG